MRLTAARLSMGVAAAVLLAGASAADARVAQQQNGGGRVLSVDPGDRGYRVKLLKDGNVRIVYVPRD